MPLEFDRARKEKLRPCLSAFWPSMATFGYGAIFVFILAGLLALPAEGSPFQARKNKDGESKIQINLVKQTFIFMCFYLDKNDRWLLTHKQQWVFLFVPCTKCTLHCSWTSSPSASSLMGPTREYPSRKRRRLNEKGVALVWCINHWSLLLVNKKALARTYTITAKYTLFFEPLKWFG